MKSTAGNSKSSTKGMAIAFLFMLSCLGVQAQDFNERFFMAFHTTTYADYAVSPVRLELAPTGNVDPITLEPIYANIPIQSANINIVSVGLEPRYNFMNLSDESALAVSMPISIGFGQTVPANTYVNGATGLGSLQLPLLAKMYFGSGSTYESEKDFGISFGAGFQYNKIGLIQVQTVELNEYSLNKGWVQPVASLGIHFWRGASPVELNILYGSGKQTDYYNDRYGEPIRNTAGQLTKATGRSRVIRFSISYLINY